ncbi:hypothetical protein, partial [Streptococcus merionis]|uniref:hypothetical protein n=1 Tax=Streptococcus merionis TaxID=400065 RepID=UPI0026F130A7
MSGKISRIKNEQMNLFDIQANRIIRFFSLLFWFVTNISPIDLSVSAFFSGLLLFVQSACFVITNSMSAL